MYKVTKDAKVGALIFDGKEVFNGMLSQASQKQLEGLFELGIKGIEADKPKKSAKKTRDNNPDSEAPKLDDATDVQEESNTTNEE